MDVWRSVVPTRYFLGRPDVGEEMHISIEKGKTLIIRLMAVGPVVEGRAQRDVWFEVNGEVYFVRSYPIPDYLFFLNSTQSKLTLPDLSVLTFRSERCLLKTKTPQ